MKALIFSIHGNLKPLALRHHVLELGNTFGIYGFLNYREGLSELYIHAEGEEEKILKFTSQVEQLIKQHNLLHYIEPGEYEEFKEFKILPFPNDTDENSLHSNIHPNTDLIQSKSAETPHADQRHRPTKMKNHIPSLGK